VALMWKKRSTAEGTLEESLEQAKRASHTGSYLATLISAIAALFSAYTFYEVRAPRLAIYVPPRIDYSDPDGPDRPMEVFVLPVTIANDGAQTGTVLSINLQVMNPRTLQVKQFYAARLGSWGEQPTKPFAPVSLSGKASFSHALQFFPRKGETVLRILDLEPGSYAFKLTLDTASTSTVKPLEFEMQIDRLDYRNFSGTGTMEMWANDYRPIATKPE
jgi:hypothetical protein